MSILERISGYADDLVAPVYQFDDAILPLGAALLARIVETRSAG